MPASKSKPPTKKSKTENGVAETNGNGVSARKDAANNSLKALQAASAAEILANSNNHCSKPLATTSAVVRLDFMTTPSFPILALHDLASPRDFPTLSNYIVPKEQQASASASRPSDGVALEDIDPIQVELETLWTTLSLRFRAIHQEQTCLFPTLDFFGISSNGDKGNHNHNSSKLVATNASTGNYSSSSSSSSKPSSPNGFRKNNTLNAVLSATALKLEQLPKKKLKGELDSKTKRGSDKPTRSGQNRVHWVNQGSTMLSYRQAPNQFWDFAENYCREVSYNDLDNLERLIEDHSTYSESLFEVPPLGPHFKEFGSNSSTRTRDRIETRSQDVCGPLTQRLVSALVDSRISGYKNGMNGTVMKQESTPEGVFVSRPGLMSALGLDGGGGNRSSVQPLEARLRQVLVEQGLLLGDNGELTQGTPMDDPRDEILADVKRTQVQLRQLHKHNEDKLKQLYYLAKREIDRGEVKRELEKADKELLEAYRIVCLSRTKKKPLSKRERELAYRALESRRTMLEKLQVQPFDLDILDGKKCKVEQPSE